MIRLASQSPRRAELLRQIGVPFVTSPADIDETPLPGESPEDFVRRMAIEKARAIHRLHADDIVLGSDTAVVLDDRIMGKPADREDAIAMLLALAGLVCWLDSSEQPMRARLPTIPNRQAMARLRAL